MGIEAGLPSHGINSSKIDNDITKKKKPLNPDTKAHEIALGVTQDAKELQSTNAPFLVSHNAKPINPNAEPGTTTTVQVQIPDRDLVGAPAKNVTFPVRRDEKTPDTLLGKIKEESLQPKTKELSKSLPEPKGDLPELPPIPAPNTRQPGLSRSFSSPLPTISSDLNPLSPSGKATVGPKQADSVGKVASSPNSASAKAVNIVGHTTKFNEIITDLQSNKHRTKGVGKGVTGSEYVGKMTKNKKNEIEIAVQNRAAIIKTMNPPPNSALRSAEIFFKEEIAGGERPTNLLVNGDVRQKMIGEAFAYDLAETVGFNAKAQELAMKLGQNTGSLVPETGVIAHKGELQSMQLFEKGVFPASAIFDKDSNKPEIIEFRKKLETLNSLKDLENKSIEEVCKLTGFKTEEIEMFQLFATLDYLMGNMDRHTENWLVKLDATGQLVGIVVIDNGNSPPERHLSDDPRRAAFIKHRQYEWSKIAF